MVPLWLASTTFNLADEIGNISRLSGKKDGVPLELASCIELPSRTDH